MACKSVAPPPIVVVFVVRQLRPAPNREFVSTPSSICLERNIGVSIRLSRCQSRGTENRSPTQEFQHSFGCLVLLGQFLLRSWRGSCLLAFVPVTTPRNGFSYSPSEFVLFPAPDTTTRGVSLAQATFDCTWAQHRCSCGLKWGLRLLAAIVLSYRMVHSCACSYVCTWYKFLRMS